MTQDIKDVLKLALEFIENSECGTADLEALIKEALREHAMREVQRLGQEIEQEPVACIYKNYLFMAHEFQSGQVPVDSKPLYTHPPQRTWVGLTDEEMTHTNHHMVEGAYQYSFKQGAKWAEAKLKEKNT